MIQVPEMNRVAATESHVRIELRVLASGSSPLSGHDRWRTMARM